MDTVRLLSSIRNHDNVYLKFLCYVPTETKVHVVFTNIVLICILIGYFPFWCRSDWVSGLDVQKAFVVWYGESVSSAWTWQGLWSSARMEVLVWGADVHRSPLRSLASFVSLPLRFFY